MAFSLSMSMITLCLVVIMGTLCDSKPAIGVLPEITAEKVKAFSMDKEAWAKHKECFKKRTNCTPVMQHLLDLLPEVYKTACASCDKRERDVYRTGARISLIEDLHFFDELISKMDKEHTYFAAFMNFILEDD